MGRRSDNEDDYDSRKSRKKKKRRSRSRSDDSGSSKYSSSKHKKSSKKSKHKRRSRSRSRDRVYRRSRSRSRGRKSRSRSRGRRRSPSRDRFGRRRTSRSMSRGRRSRSDSRSRSRRSSADRKRGRRDSPSKDGLSDFRSQIPGFDEMTPGEQVNARMKLALKAAVAADEKIREQLTATPSTEDSLKFNKAVARIEKASFAPSIFKSARLEKIKSEPKSDGYTTHDQAMFGKGLLDIKIEPTKLIYIEPQSYAHPNLYADPVEKMERWIAKLSAMRRKRIEGETYS